ncbi:bifunctional 2-polyprenyl-6-hydroxyphenol methylase/3-demethylubiquinol 3-O-methyltransferase UbiG [Alteromonas facilis]|uniref:bifunctional 2-polyprenyl-6-hydroxyphenol methylase/3-demethylubiquinol 3-O-methyltransferase UbiG n=1 Tax=Alteromonas facilis TaxID=2048004 RepID=UPI000C2906B6|nr:bifunctional 2-polyprenyl-6-hydroxyphenol methylase/3-demethylubiquinol 3-O-methyltransferase UbiG [Alteromonas facilis]
MLDKSQLTQPVDTNTTLSPQEIAKFDQMAQEWWDPQGKFKTALAFNQARLAWFIPRIAEHFGRDSKAANCLMDLSVLDVGCGGGLVSEGLARLGANVTGIDASAVSIEVARRHAKHSGLPIEYSHQLSSSLVEEGRQFDVVVNAEVIEHVPDQARLIQECCQLVKPGGMLILATLNRTFKSFIIAIVGAEYVMRYLPIGTHDWRYFVKPRELEAMVNQQGLVLESGTGMKLNIITKHWELTHNQSVNYAQIYKKP